MEAMKDPKATYSEFLITAFEKIKRAINTRKHKELKDMCTSASEQVPLDVQPDANKYFPIFKQALDTQVTKVVETTLYFLQKLIAHGFLTGSCPDNCRPPAGAAAPTRLPRQLIDTIIESICACVQERDDNVQLQVIKTLLTAVTSFSCAVHDRILLEAFRACYHIYLTSKNQVNQTTAKATLTQMLHTVCQRMESAVNQHDGPKDDGLDAMLRNVVRHMVDDVCLHSAKVEKTPEVEAPLRTVPVVLNPEDSLYKTIVMVDIQNEIGISAGKFGWCATCRRSADLYCKDTRTPICSAECKDAQLKLIDRVNKSLAGQEELNEYLNDAIIIFRSICKLSNKEIPNSAPSFTLRSKVLSLDLILAVIDNPGTVLATRKEFIEIIRSILCESLVANSLNSEKTIFTLSLSIFVALVNNFKDKLKMEVGIFLEQVLVRILASENSSFNHKLLVLQVFFRITSNPKLTVELFLNYDCDLDERDIFSRMIEMLAKIGQGKYSKAEALLQTQESALRLTALETLVNIMTSLVAWMEAEGSLKEASGTQSEDTGEEASVILEQVTEPDRFEQQKLRKSLLSKAVAKFNIKPKLAIKYLGQCGYLDPENTLDLAMFMKNTPGLNKTMIGDFLGGVDPLNRKVLNDFTNIQDYHEKALLPALRIFLNTFRLPPEGQQVDRIMEKFAEKYCKDNAGAFESADTAYVLLYSIIMLQTDANNPGVKKKMTFEDYLRITKGIDNGKDLPREFLEDIFTSIKTSPITLKDDEELMLKLETQASKRKDEMFEKESQFILAKSQESMKKARRTEFVENAAIEYIKPLFEAVWHALLAVFSVILEESQDPQTYQLALTGVLSCIRIAAKFAMPLELEGFVSCLSKFTSLLLLKEEMTPKNVECVKTLIYAAKLEANALRASWGHVLRCISKLDYLHVVSEGSKSDLFSSQPRRQEIAGAEDVISCVKMQDIDYLFSISSSLDNEAIVEFVEQLVVVSHEEIWNEQPRIFSLQALVTVADVNMNRIRLVWSKIWAYLKGHFSQAGLHPNQHIAMFAVDSLKQLAIKFLQKEELAKFRFQKEFLQPFTSILKESTSQAVKELVVDCMTNLVLTLAVNIKSGWQCIIDVFLTATLDEVLLQKIFPALVKIAESEMDKVLEQFGEILNCVMNCAVSGKEEIAIKALGLTVKCAEVLASKKIDGSSHWHVLLVRLAERLADPRPNVQHETITVLFRILETQTESFGTEEWKMVMTEVMAPLFDDVTFSTKPSADWLKTFQQLLLSFADVIQTKYERLGFLFPYYVDSLKKCVVSGVESAAKSAVLALKTLILKSGERVDSEMWKLLCGTVIDLFKATAPNELLSAPIDNLLREKREALSFSSEASVSKSVIQLQLLALVKDVLETHFSTIPRDLVRSLLGAVKDSHDFASSFNEQIMRRYALWRSGFMNDIKTLPGLLRQQHTALTLYIVFGFKLLEDGEDDRETLVSLCRTVITSYMIKEAHQAKEGDLLVQLETASMEQDVAALRPILAQFLVPKMAESRHVRSLVSTLKTEVLSLILSSSAEVREAVRTLLVLVVS